jgi:hypothetical protein
MAGTLASCFRFSPRIPSIKKLEAEGTEIFVTRGNKSKRMLFVLMILENLEDDRFFWND